jgi:Antirepressor regulating drug resistance, predicted signal transduction N-terminal membrane component
MNAVREQADRIDYPDTKIILTREKLSPYSFGKYVFLSKEDFENGRIANEILIHEKAHVTQKHWLDIFFIELLISVFWFNPVLRLYRNKMKENHEFLADEAVLRRTENIPHYQMLLINMISQKNTSLVSGFNYLTTKKRFIMMTKTFEKKAHWKKIAVVPLFILAIGIFSTKIIAENGIRPSSDSFMENHQADETLIPGQGVSPELIKEFREIVNKYIENADDNKVKWKTYNLSEEERNRLYCIYIQMNDEQRKDQYMRFRGPLTPMQLRSPNRDEWQSCKKASILWIDGKKAEPAVLNSHKRTDFTFFINNYIDTERKEYQSALWTKQGYEDYTRQYKNQISSSKLLEIKPQVWFIRDIESKKDNQRIYYGADIQNKQDN